MEVTGKVVQLLPLVKGQSAKGEWKKQEFILETQGQYPKKVCISLWGERIDQNPLQEGETITASVDLESREYNGRWYTEARAWKIAKATESSQSQPQNNITNNSAPNPPAANPDDIDIIVSGDENATDDLPF